MFYGQNIIIPKFTALMAPVFAFQGMTYQVMNGPLCDGTTLDEKASRTLVLWGLQAIDEERITPGQSYDFVQEGRSSVYGREGTGLAAYFAINAILTHGAEVWTQRSEDLFKSHFSRYTGHPDLVPEVTLDRPAYEKEIGHYVRRYG